MTPLYYIDRDEDGNMTPIVQDAERKEAREALAKFRETFPSVPVIITDQTGRIVNEPELDPITPEALLKVIFRAASESAGNGFPTFKSQLVAVIHDGTKLSNLEIQALITKALD